MIKVLHEQWNGTAVQDVWNGRLSPKGALSKLVEFMLSTAGTRPTMATLSRAKNKAGELIHSITLYDRGHEWRTFSGPSEEMRTLRELVQLINRAPPGVQGRSADAQVKVAIKSWWALLGLAVVD